MKKYLITLLVLVLLGINVTEFKTVGCMQAQAANVMEPCIWSFTIISDSGMPYVTNIFPANNATGIALDTDITFDIQDDETGIAGATLIVEVNGVVKPATLSIIDKGYHVVVTDNNFDYNSTVNVVVTVEDNAN